MGDTRKSRWMWVIVLSDTVCKLPSEASDALREPAASEDKDQDYTKTARIHRMRFAC